MAKNGEAFVIGWALLLVFLQGDTDKGAVADWVSTHTPYIVIKCKKP